VVRAASTTSASNGTVTTQTSATAPGTSGGTSLTGIQGAPTTATVQPVSVSPSAPGVYTPVGSSSTVTAISSGTGGSYGSTEVYSAYGFYGELAPLAITFSSDFYFKSSQTTMNFDVVGGVNTYVGSQVALIANYVDSNNYIAASAEINTRDWSAGDITVMLRVMRKGLPRVLNVSLGKSKQRAEEAPPKYLSLTILPENARFDGLWPITVSYWTTDAGANRAVSFTGYDPDVGNGRFFDLNNGKVATGYNLPTAYSVGTTFSVDIRDVAFGSYDPIRLGVFEYSIFTDPDEPNPPLVSLTLQGATLSVPFTAETITEVSYEVCSSPDDSSWSDWAPLATVPVGAGKSGTYIHRSTLDTLFYRYRAIYTYINAANVVVTSGPSDYIILGAGVLTPAGVADSLPSGVVIPAQTTSTTNPGGANSEALRWTNTTDGSIVAIDYSQQSGVIGTSTANTTRGIALYHPATPLYTQATFELQSTSSSSSIVLRAGNTTKLLMDNQGNSELGGGGNVTSGRLLFFS
jgi:hypothetical protein